MEPLTDGNSNGNGNGNGNVHPLNDIISFTNAVYENPTPQEIHVSPVRKLRPVRFGNGRHSSYGVDMVDPTCDVDGAPMMTCNGDLGFMNAQNESKVYGDSGFDCFNLISEAPVLDDEYSSSSDDSESSEAIEEHVIRKRKRETQKSIKLYFEDMLRRLMDKQEQFYKQLTEMIEKKEQERTIWEEAWKQQVVERAKRDGELRAEEMSRNLAIITFLENLLGEEFQIPKSSEISRQVIDEGEVHGQEAADVRSDPCNRRWPKSEVQALVSVRTALDHKFLKGAKGSVWEEVADGLTKMGYIRTPKKCKEKWENINKYYKRTIDSGKTRPKNYRSCPYFHELDMLYKNGLLNQGAGNCVKSKTRSKNAEE